MIDTTKLDDYQSSDFHAQLQLAPSHLPVELTNEFFSKLFSLFSEAFPETVGTEILNTAIRTIRSPKHLNEFLKDNFNSNLPFSDPVYYPSILNILNEYAIRAPQGFDDDLISQFSKIISYDPDKSLTIIALFLKNSKNENNSFQKMEDILFTSSENFLKQGTFQDFVSLLIFLCKTNKSFEKANKKKCWQIVCEVLKSEHRDLYVDAYNALCNLYDIDSSLIFSSEIPYSVIPEHILFTDLENAVISLLFRIVFSEKKILDEENIKFTLTDQQKIKLINPLVKISKNNESATLILCSLAENSNCAKHLVKISSKWLPEAIPTYENTFKLFGVVLKHQNLRNEITDKGEIIQFFDHMLKTKNPIIIESLSHIIRRINISDELINKLCSEIDFFRRYFSLVKRSHNDILSVSSFLLAEAISRQKYIPQLNDACELICSLVASYDDDAEGLTNNKDRTKKISAVIPAIKVATILAKHYDCAFTFKKSNLHKFLKKDLKRQGEQNIKDASKKCLKEMKKTLEHPPKSNDSDDSLQLQLDIIEEEEDV